MKKALNFIDIAIFSVKGSDYEIHFWYMSKDDAISIIKNSVLNKKNYYKFFSCLSIRKNGCLLSKK